MRDGDPYWLDREMDLDHVIRVHPGGEIDTNPRRTHAASPYAPESVVETDHEGQISADTEAAWIERVRAQDWEPETGWTGQHGYHGPFMHPSEFIGGNLADHVISTPGLWVAVSVECLPDEDPDPDRDHDPDDCKTCERKDSGDFEPAGWAILHMDDSPGTDSYVVSLEAGEITRKYTNKCVRSDLATARKTAALARPILKAPVRIVRVTDLAVMEDEQTPAERIHELEEDQAIALQNGTIEAWEAAGHGEELDRLRAARG